MSSKIQIGECFDPNQEYFVEERLRPHWCQAGAIVFITFRTADSIPKEVLTRWDREKNEWLRRRGLLNGKHWSEMTDTISVEVRYEFNRRFNRTREEFLDTCCGECVLRDAELARIVHDSLLHFDGERYQMGDFIVMPNHVHLLVAFPTEDGMKKQLTSWMHYTAVKINRSTGNGGHFWQPEPFDHLVRSPEQYEYVRRYIKENPTKASLRRGEYLHYQRE